MARWKTADAIAVEGIKNEDDDRQIDECKYKRGIKGEQRSTAG